MAIPGLDQAKYVEGKIRELGITDVKLFYDSMIQPQGMWVVCQVKKNTGRILLPDNYQQDDIKPMIMWYCKTADGHFRFPGEQDISDIVVIVNKAQKTWDEGGDVLADRLDAQSAEKDEKHQAAFKQKIHTIAKPMKKAIRSGNL